MNLFGTHIQYGYYTIIFIFYIIFVSGHFDKLSDHYSPSVKLRVFRGALGYLKVAGITVNGRFFCAPEPVALTRQHLLSRCFSSVPVVIFFII
jgi:hypothetical protein